MFDATLLGTIGSVGEIREHGGQEVINFSVAVIERVSKEKREKTETQWVRVSYWREPTKTGLFQYLKPGQQVLIQGRPFAKTYKGKDNTIQAEIYLTARDVSLVGKKDNFNERLKDVVEKAGYDSTLYNSLLEVIVEEEKKKAAKDKPETDVSKMSEEELFAELERRMKAKKEAEEAALVQQTESANEPPSVEPEPEAKPSQKSKNSKVNKTDSSEAEPENVDPNWDISEDPLYNPNH